MWDEVAEREEQEAAALRYVRSIPFKIHSPHDDHLSGLADRATLGVAKQRCWEAQAAAEAEAERIAAETAADEGDEEGERDLDDEIPDAQDDGLDDRRVDRRRRRCRRPAT